MSHFYSVRCFAFFHVIFAIFSLYFHHYHQFFLSPAFISVSLSSFCFILSSVLLPLPVSSVRFSLSLLCYFHVYRLSFVVSFVVLRFAFIFSLFFVYLAFLFIFRVFLLNFLCISRFSANFLFLVVCLSCINFPLIFCIRYLSLFPDLTDFFVLFVLFSLSSTSFISFFIIFLAFLHLLAFVFVIFRSLSSFINIFLYSFFLYHFSCVYI